MANPTVPCRFVRLPSTEAPFLRRHYPASTVIRTSPPPHTARPDSHELLVDHLRVTVGVSRVASAPRCLHAVAHTPAGPMNLFAHIVASASAFPVRKAGRLLHYPFRGLLSVHSRYGLHAHRVAIATLCIEGFSGFVTSTAASIVTGRNEPVPGRDFHPLWTSAFARRTFGLGLVNGVVLARVERHQKLRSHKASNP